MSENEIVQHMVDFIESKEREIQADKFTPEKKTQKDTVQAILDELDREVSDEDK